jgi:hypothetical protein
LFDTQNDANPVEKRIVSIAILGFFTALVAAGSTGMLNHQLRHVITWIGAALIVFLAWPNIAVRRSRAKLLIFYLPIHAVLTFFAATTTYLINLFTFVIVFGAVTATQPKVFRSLLNRTLLSVFLFALFKLFVEFNPYAYFTADKLSWGLSRLASKVFFQDLNIGMSVSGFDQIFLFLVWYIAWLRSEKLSTKKQAIFPIVAALAIYGIYLAVLSHGALFSSYVVDDPNWAASSLNLFLRWLFPWHLQSVLSLFYCAIIYDLAANSTSTRHEASSALGRRFSPLVARHGTPLGLFCAFALVLLSCFYPTRASLANKEIVFNKDGFLNWLKPEHGDYGHLSIGMYGMLPDYLRSMGAVFKHTESYSENDLKDADLLVLIYPNEPWQPGQLERIWDYVQNGGNLLLLGEHTVQEADGGSRINEVLEPTSIRLNFDSSMFTVGGWLMSYDTAAHPATIGLKDDRNQLGFVVGATLETGFPAKPLIRGRWGWADPGDSRTPSMMGNNRYDPGERLGDLTLAAEQNLGKGRVFVLSDTSTFSNGLLIGNHDFPSRLLAYLAQERPRWISNAARYSLMTLAIFLLACLTLLGEPEKMIRACSMGLTLLIIFASTYTYHAGKLAPSRPAPDQGSSRHIAYIDSSHINSFSSESWREDGVMGLCLNLMRNNFLVFTLPEFDKEKISQADLLIIITPLREYSVKEIASIRDFVEKGGTLIVTVGYDQSKPSASLLREFEFSSAQHDEIPVPSGFFKTPYLNAGSHYAYARLHAGWPIYSDTPHHIKRAFGHDDAAVMLERSFGNGYVIFIGDGGFALNKNLEHENGEPFEGLRENADYWRWLNSFLRYEQLWVPPASDG